MHDGLSRVARELELRWRVRIFTKFIFSGLIFSVGVSLAAVLVDTVFSVFIPTGRIVLVANGAVVAAGLVLGAARRVSPVSVLSDADRVYATHDLLSSAMDFAESSPAESETENGFRRTVISSGQEMAASIDPAAVYPFRVPGKVSILFGMIAAIGILLLLDVSGWFSRPVIEMAQEGFLLEDAARRLADGGDPELQELSDEIRRLGERLRDGEIEADEARRRIDQLGQRVEEQVRDLQRLGELATNQDAELPPEVEPAVRNALRSGMSEGEVLDYFMTLQSEGEQLPDVLRALEEATSDRQPDTNLDLDDERVRDLMDQLNLDTQPQGAPDLSEELEFARRTLQQAGNSVEELTEGEDDEFDESGEGSAEVRGGMEPSGAPSETDESGGNRSDGQAGGDQAVADAMGDTFTRIEDANPVFRQIEGIVGEGTIRDVIIRELPSEAVSQLDEIEREVVFERVIEEAVVRENVPPELQQLLRNYFLRITLGSDQGEQDEQ